MLRMRNTHQNDVGFVDPNRIFKDTVTLPKNWLCETETNLLKFFRLHRAKELILFPYCFE